MTRGRSMLNDRQRRPLRVVRSFALPICLFLAGISGGAIPACAGQRRAIATETVTLPTLRQPVEILIDRWGVPHIYARNEADLFFAQGFNAARDRLFQIDLWRRRGLGQLSEVLGPAHIERDRAARLFLYRGDMDREWRIYSSHGTREAEPLTSR